jgi:hypothetical protein
MDGAASLANANRCWNGIFRYLSNFQNRMADFKAKNSNITIIPEEMSPRLKKLFSDLVNILLTENQAYNTNRELNDSKSQDGLDWVCGPGTEFVFKNDVLGTIVSYGIADDMPSDLIDEIAYFFAVIANEIPSAFIVNENVHRPLSLFLDALCKKPSKYSLVLADKLVMRVKEYPPLWNVFVGDGNSLGKLLAYLFTIEEAFDHCLTLSSLLLEIDCVGFEDFTLSCTMLEITMVKLTNLFDLVISTSWSLQPIEALCKTLSLIDRFDLALSDNGKTQLAAAYKENFVNSSISPALRMVKLFDGTVIKSLHLLTLVLKRVKSLELSLPLVSAYRQYFFSDVEQDCLNLPRLFFTEGETELSLAIVEFLEAVVNHESRILLRPFEETNSPVEAASSKWIKPVSLANHLAIEEFLIKGLGLLPEQCMDQNTENMNLLYKTHLFHGEISVPESAEKLNSMTFDSYFLSSLLVKMIDSCLLNFWGRTPTDNLPVLRFFLSFISKCRNDLLMDHFLAASHPFSIMALVESLLWKLTSQPVSDFVSKPETLRSISRFRAGLFDKLHEGKAIWAVDMFEGDGLLSNILAGMDPKTVGALSGNVILLQAFIMRLLAVIQVQSTRTYKVILFD